MKDGQTPIVTAIDITNDPKNGVDSEALAEALRQLRRDTVIRIEWRLAKLELQHQYQIGDVDVVVEKPGREVAMTEEALAPAALKPEGCGACPFAVTRKTREPSRA